MLLGTVKESKVLSDFVTSIVTLELLFPHFVILSRKEAFLKDLKEVMMKHDVNHVNYCKKSEHPSNVHST